MFCKNCGAEIPDNAVVCMKCGVLAGDGDRYCPNCGAEPDSKAVVCVKCGCALKSFSHKDRAQGKTHVTLKKSIQACYSKYATFSGRACRAEYWYWCLFNIIIMLSAFALAAFFVALRPIIQPNATQDAAACVIIGMIFYFGGLLWVIFGNLLPSLAVSVRRLHDTNRSGWWLLISLLPLIGRIILLIWMCQDSDPYTNKYGVNTKKTMQ